MTVASARHILVKTEEECLKLRELILNEGKEFSDKTSVTICKNFSCSLPMFELEQIEDLL